MSRKYMNDKWCVRCGKTSPTPYLKKNLKLLQRENYEEAQVIDIGCGNGRNTKFLMENGFKNCRAFDMVNDFGEKMTLGHDTFPVVDNSVDVILANYILMFLDNEERKQVITEIDRMSRDGCIFIMELYPAKDSYAKTKEESIKMQKEIFDTLGWEKIRYSQERFIVLKKDEVKENL